MKTSLMRLPRKTEVEIWNRLIPPNDMIPPAVAQWLQGLSFSDADLARMRELSHKAQEGRLSVDEHAEMELFEHVGDMLSILKAKSLKTTKPRTKTR